MLSMVLFLPLLRPAQQGPTDSQCHGQQKVRMPSSSATLPPYLSPTKTTQPTVGDGDKPVVDCSAGNYGAGAAANPNHRAKNWAYLFLIQKQKEKCRLCRPLKRALDSCRRGCNGRRVYHRATQPLQLGQQRQVQRRSELLMRLFPMF